MQSTTSVDKNIESKFLLLSLEEKIAVISHGAAIHFSDLNNRLFLAQSKINHFEGKYHIKLSKLEEKGLPDNADFEMHEDYIMWHHWAEVAKKVRKQIKSLQTITEYGVYK